MNVEIGTDCSLSVIDSEWISIPVSARLCQVSTDIFTFLLSFHPGEADPSLQKLETAYVIRIQPAI